MISEQIDVAFTLPRNLWEVVVGRAQNEQETETALLVRAIEQFLQQPDFDQINREQLERECVKLAQLDFDDIGTEEEWVVVQNEALHSR